MNASLAHLQHEAFGGHLCPGCREVIPEEHVEQLCPGKVGRALEEARTGARVAEQLRVLAACSHVAARAHQARETPDWRDGAADAIADVRAAVTADRE